MSFIVDEIVEQIKALSPVDAKEFKDFYRSQEDYESLREENIELKNEVEIHDADADSFADATVLAEEFIESIGKTEEFKKYKEEQKG